MIEEVQGAWLVGRRGGKGRKRSRLAEDIVCGRQLLSRYGAVWAKCRTMYGIPGIE